MSARNSVKEFVADSYYHLYNRGVEKRVIFLDGQDYAVFLSYLKTYLTPKDIPALQTRLADPKIPWNEKNEVVKLLRMNNFSETLELVAYCLMPNHFHLLIKQTQETAIDMFMNSLCTRYAMYINRKYHRIGVLFQDVYKAVRILSDEQLLHLSRYIHRNPLTIEDSLRDFEYSSYREYVGLRRTDWVKPSEILSHFSHNSAHTYEKFVEFDKEEIEESYVKVYIDTDDSV